MATKTVSSGAACPAYEVVLEDYLNGELSTAEAHSAEEHWKTCAACRTALDQAAASMRLLRAAEKSTGPGPGFARVVMARVRMAEQERAAARTIFWQPFVSWGWKFAATAALALVGMVTYDAGWNHASHPSADEVRAATVHELFDFAPEPGRTPADRDEVLMMVAETSHGNQR